jgi:threonyl-tRNA synthetase
LRRLNREHGFQDVISPLVMSEDLWKTSGHYDNYAENMYFTEVDERNFAVKPMNCPGHCLIYGNDRHSYRELPMRFAEFGRVHRHERSGVTAGLFRVRSFVQDDAHIFCTEDQIESEIVSVLKMVRLFYAAFGFEYRVELSTRPEKRIGADSTWDKAEAALARTLEKDGLDYKVNPGDGAFYGPKIDFHLKDSIGRTHQCGTVQLDFMMPERFGLNYLGSDNAAHPPVMIHRAIAGSLERFLGIYIEHVAGNFPFWLAPTQVIVLTVADEAKPFAEKLYAQMKTLGLRVSLDDSQDKLSGKIKKHQSTKAPYMVIIGAREAAAEQVSLRHRDGNKQEQGIALDTLLTRLVAEAQPPQHS